MSATRDELREAVARAIACGLGDNFDHAFVTKSEWTQARGEKGGRARDINEPMQGDYLDAADAAIAATEQAGWVLVPASEEYLIWSIQHGMWWRPGSKGYTLELAEAGRYSREEAIEISRGGDRWRPFHRPREVPVLVDDAAMLNADLRDDAESFEDDEEYEANEGDWTLGP